MFKEGDRDNLSIVPACENDAYFDSESWGCKLCEDGTRSWGLQSEECEPCIRIWWFRNTDDYNRSMYEQYCIKGSIKSKALFYAIPLVSILLIAIMCMKTRHNGMAKEAGYEFQARPVQRKAYHRTRDSHHKDEESAVIEEDTGM